MPHDRQGLTPRLPFLPNYVNFDVGFYQERAMRSRRQHSLCPATPRRGHHRDNRLRRIHDLSPMMTTWEKEEFLGIPLVLHRRDRRWDRHRPVPPPDEDDEWLTICFLGPPRRCCPRVCHGVITLAIRLLAAIFHEPIAFFPSRPRLLRRMRCETEPMKE